jgi:hypothetical protein
VRTSKPNNVAPQFGRYYHSSKPAPYVEPFDSLLGHVVEDYVGKEREDKSRGLVLDPNFKKAHVRESLAQFTECSYSYYP